MNSATTQSYAFMKHLAALLVGAGVLYLCSCTGGGDGSLAGAATIRGTVAEFEGQTVAWIAPREASLPAVAWAAVMDLLAPPAHAAVEGVTVQVAGTDLITSTASDGFFIISGVSPGMVDLIFSVGEETAVLGLDVPSDSTIELREIHISAGEVTVEEVQVSVRASAVEELGSVDVDGDGESEEVFVIEEDDDDSGRSGSSGSVSSNEEREVNHPEEEEEEEEKEEDGVSGSAGGVQGQTSGSAVSGTFISEKE